MIESDLVNALNDSIDRMAAGATIAECLQRHPQVAAALEPLLESGQLVRRAQPSAEEAQQARDRQMPRYERLLAETQPYHRPLSLARLAQWAAIFVLVFGLGSALAAEQSLPGDALYGMKRLTENARIILLPDTAALFEQRRFDEARQIVTLRREAEVTLTGEIVDLTDAALVIEGLAIRVGDAPQQAALMPGMRVEIRAQSTALGELWAQNIRILDAPETPEHPVAPGDTPAPAASDRPESTRQPTRAITSTPQRTPDAEAVESTPAACIVSQPDGWIAYGVQPGDTLSDLAARSGTSAQVVAEANCLSDSRLIVAGQRLYLPRTPVPRPTPTPTPEPLVRPTDTPPPATRQESSGGDVRPSRRQPSTPQVEAEEGGGQRGR